MSEVWSRVRRADPAGSVAARNPAVVPDVVVVGGGAAGLAAAAVVRDAGGDVVLVSDGPLGGDCTWHGCVPTKSLLEAAAGGLDAHEAVVHARAVVARVARLENEHALTRSGVRVLRGRAVLGADAVVRVRPHAGARGGPHGGDAEPEALLLRPGRGVVLATGSRPDPVDCLPTGPPARGGGGPVVADTDGWLDALEHHLGRLGEAGPGGVERRDVVVVGGGGSGVELAQALARLGAAGPTGTVTLLEQAGHLLPGTPGAGELLAGALRGDGVRVLTGAGPELLARTAGAAGLVLLAAGRSPVLDVLGPDAGVRTRAGAVVVDAAMATSAPRVRAAGDLVGLSPSTHVAVATGRVAAAGLLDLVPDAPTFDATWVPRVVWTDPQVAAVGRVPGGPGTREVRVPVSRNDRAATAAVPAGPGRPARARAGVVHAWAEPEPDHAWDRGGRLVGVLLVGPLAGELVAEAALVGRLGLSVQEWVGGRVGLGALAAQHPYPAWGWTWQLVADRLLRP